VKPGEVFAEHDRAESRSPRQFRLDAMVLSGVFLTRCTACLGRALRRENILLFVIAGLDPAIHAARPLVHRVT